jgi:hypothetical protein
MVIALLLNRVEEGGLSGAFATADKRDRAARKRSARSLDDQVGARSRASSTNNEKEKRS